MGEPFDAFVSISFCYITGEGAAPWNTFFLEKLRDKNCRAQLLLIGSLIVVRGN